MEIEAHEQVITDGNGGGRGSAQGKGERGAEIDGAVEGIERGVDGLDGDEERVGGGGRGCHGEHLGDGGGLDAGRERMESTLWLLAGG